MIDYGDTAAAADEQEGAMGEQRADGRQAELQEMATYPLDVLVIGGGITGAGVALDAAARGYRVGLVERGDFASGTSCASTKLVHGGIRYLPEFDIAMVREALIERGRLLRNASHLVHPLAFVLPLYASSRHPVGLPVAPPFGIGLGFILDAGLWVYDVLAGKENVGEHRRISREQTIERAASLTPKGIKTGYIYYDAQTDDTRLTMAVLRTAMARGAHTANYAEAVRFSYDGQRITGVWVRDTLDQAGDELLVRARHVVNATGVWAEQTERLAGESPELHIAPSKGVHLVLDRATLGLGEEAIVLPETEDGRIIFIVPWQSRALVGTTDTPVRAIEQPVASEDDINYLLDHLNRYLRKYVRWSDILTTFAGNRPLLRVRRRDNYSDNKPARLSRSHEVVESDAGLISVSGGKLTTYRRMAQDVVDQIDRREKRTLIHPTLKLTLRGSGGWAEARPLVRMRGRALGLADD
ncbi:MAG TPA: glycerol-3-phosphate dehydrogenase/oxidase, partial [Ktedonobacterales bacterium]|nr:glycerol-3-phosphate dehydrogenase/oxidase [Ktedonobacterales bacterium]